MKKILLVADEASYVYTLRLELLGGLLAEGFAVCVCARPSPDVAALEKLGCRFIPVEYNRHGTNPLDELKLLSFYRSLMQAEAPDAVLTFTIKPNVYAGMVCAAMKIPYFVSITGLGSALVNGGILRKLTLLLYRIGTKKASVVFFQNVANRDFMRKHGIAVNTARLLAGSGVNLQKHCFEPYPAEEKALVFLTVGRIMRDKGTSELLAAAQAIKQEFPHVSFQLVGSYDGDYRAQIEAAVNNGTVSFLGYQSDIHSFMKQCHAVVHPSYHEGMANVLLEGAAAGRPVIASDVPGCIETFTPGVSGIPCRAKDSEDLTRAIREFILLPHEAKAQMGHAGRAKVEQEFDRRIIVQTYINEIKKVLGDETSENI